MKAKGENCPFIPPRLRLARRGVRREVTARHVDPSPHLRGGDVICLILGVLRSLDGSRHYAPGVFLLRSPDGHMGGGYGPPQQRAAPGGGGYQQQAVGGRGPMGGGGGGGGYG